ncbi:MAG: tRNA (guanosine(46)-N7)-methyltransferase TrmB [Bacteroidota bacterium]
MARRKREKLRQIAERTNVIEPGRTGDEKLKGSWQVAIFRNEHPIVVELGCGRGEYSVGLASVYSEKNFIGFDVKGDRIWMGSGQAMESGLDNVVFVRMQIQWLANIFAPGEINEIWITFPDPRPKDRDEKHRLTTAQFMAMYRYLLAPDGIVHLKTDSDFFFDYTLDVLKSESIRDFHHTRDLYQSEMNNLHHGIKTRYESIFTEKGFSIKYLQFKFA